MWRLAATESILTEHESLWMVTFARRRKEARVLQLRYAAQA